MNALDTNILARFILRDDETQTRTADALLMTPVWVTITVWLELGWILGKQLRLERHAVGDALETLLALDTVHTADREGLFWAIDRFRVGADWADMIHLVAVRGSAETFSTFDSKLPRHAGSAAPVQINSIA